MRIKKLVNRAQASAVAILLPLAAGAAVPHREEIAPGVWAAGFADKYKSANSGWVVAGGDVLLIDVPWGVDAAAYLDEVKQTSGRAAKKLLLTNDAIAAEPVVQELARLGVERVTGDLSKLAGVEVLPYGENRRAVVIADKAVVFAGPAITNGPRADTASHALRDWVPMLGLLASKKPHRVVPGRGSWGSADLIERQRRFVQEVKRQVAYGISMGRPVEAIERELLLPASYYTWMPYDNPRLEDVRHVYRELTGSPFTALSSSKPNALVLIGDRFHEPEHLEEGLRPALEAAGVVPHFTVDIAALNAVNLAKVQLLVILRDGMLWPGGPSEPYKIWMTPEQEKAVVEYVEGGGSFLNLHNSMGLYPKDGPYLNLVGGRYIGHGPLERFRVEVVDKDHPVTQGVADWFAADEQHTPPYDDKKARLLLRNRSDEGKTAAAGWAYEPGRGRLVHLASGHTREALNHPMFQKLVRNSVGWLLRK